MKKFICIALVFCSLYSNITQSNDRPTIFTPAIAIVACMTPAIVTFLVQKAVAGVTPLNHQPTDSALLAAGALSATVAAGLLVTNHDNAAKKAALLTTGIVVGHSLIRP